jgi:hypothetical protein
MNLANVAKATAFAIMIDVAVVHLALTAAPSYVRRACTRKIMTNKAKATVKSIATNVAD